jgi:hypothetical protein
MLKLRSLKLVLLFVLTGSLFLLSNCNKSSNGPGPQTTLQNQQDSTKYYVYHIDYPDSALARPLADSLQNFGRLQKQAFMKAQPPDTSQYNVTPYELLVKFKKVFDSPQVVSYIANAYQFTGGAHGRSMIQTFNYDVKNGDFITLQTLFEDTTALEPISKFAKHKIVNKYYKKNEGESTLRPFEKKWVKRGTAPITKNYRYFYFAGKTDERPTGVEIIFPPYQVGPHSFGIPKVFIPDSIFYKHLTADYQGMFVNQK